MERNLGLPVRKNHASNSEQSDGAIQIHGRFHWGQPPSSSRTWMILQGISPNCLFEFYQQLYSKWLDKSSGFHIKYQLFPTHKENHQNATQLPTTSPILVRLQLIQHEEGATCTAKPWAGGNFHRSCCWWFRNLATKAPFGCMKLTHKVTAADGSEISNNHLLDVIETCRK